MNKKTILLIIFFALSFINLVIYFKRDYFFYQSFPSAASLYAPCNSACIKKWKQFVSDYPGEQMQKAKNILDSSLTLSNLNTSDKALLIGNFLYRHFNKQTGIPSASLSSEDPLEQFKRLSRNDSEKLWCGTYANMFTYFCWCQGITSRVIEIFNPGDHHVINEYYSPEKKQWIMVDVTNNMLMAEDSNQQFLNVLSFIERATSNSILTVYRSSEDSVKRNILNTADFSGKKYFKKDYQLYYYFRVNTKKVYETMAKIRRYLLPETWYSVYDFGGQTKNNFLYLVKVFLICTWLVVAIFMAKLILFKHN